MKQRETIIASGATSEPSEHTQATARPWDFHIQPFEFRSGEGIDYSLMTDDGVVMFVLPPGPANAKFKANAALIVKAVNNFDALVKALEELLAPMADIADERLASLKTGQIMPATGKHSAATILRARAALAGAK